MAAAKAYEKNHALSAFSGTPNRGWNTVR